MKIFVLFLFLLFSFSAFSEVYFCVENKLSGYQGPDHSKLDQYKPRRFKIDLDFKNLTAISEDISFYSNLMEGGNCIKNDQFNTMTCTDGIGASFYISELNKRFVLSGGFGFLTKGSDAIYLSLGECEIF